MPRLIAPLLLLTALAACNPQTVAQNINTRAARSVVVPVMQNYMTAPQAEAAADCVIANASPAELQGLARDVGVRAGTLTVQNVANILRRPATASCMRARGIGPVAG
ncbi:hypothetical protein KM031_13930 [Gemmobacter fulvus]|uniref:Succinate dehydrogenase n=1 Tax=Gemmobacter fulvus TaxID=2840474 RepID=A0A975P4X8_9RHOB|nr:hypothetical protein [Gemmobacter fulvus]MBT9247574.1 hypothetical protein [Gemmobacter fulvus]QWK89919.1 hypothetical protein KM031_13930 [Gemmobacter fulvus]